MCFMFALKSLCFKTQLLFVIKFLWMSGFDGLLFYTSLLQLDSKYNQNYSTTMPSSKCIKVQVPLTH